MKTLVIILPLFLHLSSSFTCKQWRLETQSVSLPHHKSSTVTHGNVSVYRRNSYYTTALAVATPHTREFIPRPIITFKSSGKKLNFFGVVTGTVAVLVGMLWWVGLLVCELLYAVGLQKKDKNRRVPVALTHLWGATIMTLTNCWPIFRGKDNLQLIPKDESRSKRKRSPAVFVANHCSWMDIPYVGSAIGNANYKMVSYQGMANVPVLSKAIRLGGMMLLDRSDRRSQVETFKQGVNWLKRGADVVVFPEGKLSQTGRIGPFKRGAFGMALRANVPIVPISISNSDKVQPPDYAFPIRSSRSVPVIVQICKPISVHGKTDHEISEEVRNAIIEHLPKCQWPTETN